MKKYFLLFFMLNFSILLNAYAINPPHVVYRADGRNMTEIIEAEGMWPKWERTDMPDDDLIHHFEGESIEGGTSNFVSTSLSLRGAVEHAASLARPNSETPFEPGYLTYIYVIRPDDSFYDVDASLTARRNATTDVTQRDRLDAILRDYAGMEEWAAREGFLYQRIISRAQLTGAMLQQYGVNPGSPLFSDSFYRWEVNPHYNHVYDEDVGSNEAYPQVGMPGGYVDEVGNGDQMPVRLGFTCMGVSSDFRESQLRSSTNTCSANQYLNIKRSFYDKESLNIILMLINQQHSAYVPMQH